MNEKTDILNCGGSFLNKHAFVAFPGTSVLKECVSKPL